jgi:hypothetical protein
MLRSMADRVSPCRPWRAESGPGCWSSAAAGRTAAESASAAARVCAAARCCSRLAPCARPPPWPALACPGCLALSCLVG